MDIKTDNREVLLDVKDLEVTFGTGKKKMKAVNGVSFQVYKGETFGIVGESGSGKTTIGRAIMRIYPTSGGIISYKGQQINGKISRQTDRRMTREIQMIFQDPIASLNERAKVDYIISEGISSVEHLSKEEKTKRVEKILKQVGLLPEFASRFPHEFSGGQRQRIGIARSLIMEPEFIIADEPISALDVSVRAQILNLLSRLQKEKGLTYLFIAHDLSVMRHITNRIAVVYKGKIVELAETEELYNHPVHPYTKALLSAIPLPNPLIERDKDIYVYDPSMHHYEEDKPEFVELFPQHFVLANKQEQKAYKESYHAGICE